jgi:hypothetical protein
MATLPVTDGMIPRVVLIIVKTITAIATIIQNIFMQSLVFTCATCGIEKSSNDFQSRIDSDTGYRIYPHERGIPCR